MLIKWNEVWTFYRHTEKKPKNNQNNPPSAQNQSHIRWRIWSHLIPQENWISCSAFLGPPHVQWCISSSTCTSLSETSCWHHKYLKHFEWLFLYFYIELLHKYQFSNQCTIQNCFFKHHLGKENTICFKVTAFFFLPELKFYAAACNSLRQGPQGKSLKWARLGSPTFKAAASWTHDIDMSAKMFR